MTVENLEDMPTFTVSVAPGDLISRRSTGQLFQVTETGVSPVARAGAQIGAPASMAAGDPPVAPPSPVIFGIDTASGEDVSAFSPAPVIDPPPPAPGVDPETLGVAPSPNTGPTPDTTAPGAAPSSFGIQPPSIGRIVHYYDGRNSTPRPAFIVDTFPESAAYLVTLSIFTPGDERVGTAVAVPYGEAGGPGEFWTWPAKV